MVTKEEKMKKEKLEQRGAEEELVRRLAGMGLPVEQQFQEYNKITLKARRTFFDRRRELNLKSHRLLFTFKPKKDICYFCSKQAQHTHHIDKNTKNNSEKNLLPLCCRCHTRLHRLYKYLGIKDNGK